MERGDRLKILRMLNGLSQDDLAKHLNSSQGNIATWERKNMFPRDNNIARKLSEVLHASIGYLAYGESTINCSFWEPLPPSNPRHFNTYLLEICRLFSELCSENKIDHGVYCNTGNIRLFFLGQKETPLSYVLALKHNLVSKFSEALSTLELSELKGFEPPLPTDLNLLSEENLNNLSDHIRLSNKMETDVEAIYKAFQRLKDIRGVAAQIDTSSFARNAFLHFHIVLQEFEKPEDWKPEGYEPYIWQSIVCLSHVYERIYEEIVSKSLVWQGHLEMDIANILRRLLKEQGLKEKPAKKSKSSGVGVKPIEWDF